MKIAHIVQVTPHRAGLYETARELAAAMQERGHEVRMIDPINKKSVENDRGVLAAESSFAASADVLVNHSGLSAELNKLAKPIVHMLHGRPYSSFLLEQQGKIAVMSFWRKVVGDPRYKAFVTFWPSFMPYFANYFPSDKLHVLNPPVDLESWTPKGPAGYQFHGKGGHPNIVCTDLWRDDKDPYHVLNAFMYYADRVGGARIHIYAAPQKGTAWGILKATLREKGYLGECLGMIKGLDNVYRAADVMITPHRIATRSVREALACGCQVVMAPGEKFSPYQADPEDLIQYAAMINRAYHDTGNILTYGPNRAVAEKFFDPAKTAEQFENILERAVGAKPNFFGQSSRPFPIKVKQDGK